MNRVGGADTIYKMFKKTFGSYTSHSIKYVGDKNVVIYLNRHKSTHDGVVEKVHGFLPTIKNMFTSFDKEEHSTKLNGIYTTFTLKRDNLLCVIRVNRLVISITFTL